MNSAKAVIVISTIISSVASLQITLQRNTPVIPKLPDSCEERSGKRPFGNFFNPDELINYLDVMYIARIGVGTPIQDFNIIFDTTISDTFIASAECLEGCAGKRQYNRSQSSTSTSSEKVFSTIYQNDGSFQGVIGCDDFHINGTKITNVTFGEITSISKSGGSHLPFDGVVGLGFKEFAFDKNHTFLQSLSNSGKLDNSIFSIYKEGSDSDNKIILFGNYPADNINGNLTFVKIAGSSWHFQLDNITTEEDSIEYCTKGCTAYAQTGCPFIRGPQDEIDSLNYAISAKRAGEYYIIDCIHQPSKKVRFGIGQAIFEIGPEDYILSVQFSDGSVMCMSAFLPRDEPVWDLGMPFVGSVLTMFDFGKGRIGFAKNLWDK